MTEVSDGSFQTIGQRGEHTQPGERFVVLAAREATRGMGEALLQHIDCLMQQARHAPGFERIDILRPFGEPEIFLHYEVWSDKPAHDAFDAGSQHETFAAQAKHLVSHHNIPVHYRLERSYRAAFSAPAIAKANTVAIPRLPLVDPGSASKNVRDTFATLPASLAIFRAAANAESLFSPLMEIARTILGNDMALSVRIRELVILQVGQLSGATYELSQHEPLALRAGIEQRQIEALRRGDEEDGFGEADRLVLRFVREALIAADVSDDAWATAAAKFESRALTELIVIVGFYRMMCTLMRAARLSVDAPIDRSWPTPDGSSLRSPVAQS